MSFDADQIRSGQTCLQVGKNLGAGERALQAVILLGLGENNMHSTGCASYSTGTVCGYFQLNTHWQAQHDYHDVHYWAAYAFKYGFWGKGGLLNLARFNPHESIGWIVNQCQGAFANADEGARYYNRYLPTMDEFINKYLPHGAGPGTPGGGPPRPIDPTTTLPPTSDYDPSPIIRNATYQLGVHGLRAFNNANYLLKYVDGVRYITTAGPH